jgi:archaemetzincin
MKTATIFLMINALMLFGAGCHNPESFDLKSFASLISKNDLPPGKPQPGDWLYDHPEKGQSLEQYMHCHPVSPDDQRKIIYLQPIGEFDSISNALIRHTAEYIQIFFGLKTVVLKTIGNEIFPDSVTRRGENNDTQVYAPFILDEILIRRMPADGIAFMALTEKDLYPNPDWNFVFGLANLRERVGVSSLYRLTGGDGNPSDITTSLGRLIKVTSHEICHMFTMYHCIHAECTMNGSNSLPETDRKPNRLCSECTAKLVWNLNYDPLKRMESLQQFFRQYHLNKDRLLTEADIKVTAFLKH